MKYRARSLAVGLAVATLAFPAISHAKDLCVMSGANNLVVLRKFKMPKAGTCRPVAGNNSQQVMVASGAACTTSDGATLQIHYTARNGNFDSFENLVLLPLPSMTEGTFYSKTNNVTTGTSLGSISAVSCKGEPVL